MRERESEREGERERERERERESERKGIACTHEKEKMNHLNVKLFRKCGETCIWNRYNFGTTPTEK